MSHEPIEEQRETEVRTTWFRRYTVDPNLADEFVQFLLTKVFPARRAFGFRPEQVWVDADKTHVTWFVSAPLNSEDFARLETNWENSLERARVFDGTPQYILAKDLHEAHQIFSFDGEDN